MEAVADAGAMSRSRLFEEESERGVWRVRKSETLVQVSQGQVSSGHCSRGGGVPRLGRRYWTRIRAKKVPCGSTSNVASTRERAL